MEESEPPSNKILSPPGKLQQRWRPLFCLRVREGTNETSVPLIFKHDRSDDESEPPQRRPEQEEWLLPAQSSGMSWRVQEVRLDGLYNNTVFLDPPSVMRNPGIINNCRTTVHRLPSLNIFIS